MKLNDQSFRSAVYKAVEKIENERLSIEKEFGKGNAHINGLCIGLKRASRILEMETGEDFEKE